MDAFEEFLREHSGEKFCTVTPGGNHGDTLIHMGLNKKLDEHGIDYASLNLEEIYSGDVVSGLKYVLNIAAWKTGLERGFQLLEIPGDADLILFEGGGYMNDIWYGPVLLKQVLRRHSQPVVIAPQSYWFESTDLMGHFTDDRSVTLFCRERRSQELLQGMPRLPNVDIKTSGDTALYLDADDLRHLIKPAREPHDLICFREDKESIIAPKKRREIIEASEAPLVTDISKKGDLGDFVSTIANARRVHTDRLHVAIAAHILRKEATLYPNRYHKNRGVYEYSLAGDPGIRFIDT
jgi:exopolysaccharide biosynthesis predicted pyruvyltransferase EpsI